MTCPAHPPGGQPLVYRLTVRIESVRGDLPRLDDLRHDLLRVIAEALPGATSSGVSGRVLPGAQSATFHLTVMAPEVITRDDLYLIEVGTLEVLPSPIDPRTLAVFSPDVTVHAQPLRAA